MASAHDLISAHDAAARHLALAMDSYRETREKTDLPDYHHEDAAGAEAYERAYIAAGLDDMDEEVDAATAAHDAALNALMSYRPRSFAEVRLIAGHLLRLAEHDDLWRESIADRLADFLRALGGQDHPMAETA